MGFRHSAIKDPAPFLCDNPDFLLLFQDHVASLVMSEGPWVIQVLTAHWAGGRFSSSNHLLCSGSAGSRLWPEWVGSPGLTRIHRGPLPNPEPGGVNQPCPSQGGHTMRRLQWLLRRGQSPLCHRRIAEPMESLVSTLVTQLPPYGSAHVPRTQVTAGSSSKNASARPGSHYGRPLLTLTHAGDLGVWCPGPQRE